MNDCKTTEPILERVREWDLILEVLIRSKDAGLEEDEKEAIRGLIETAERLQTENEELRKNLKTLPDILYKELDGHKGQARRIAIQHLST